MPRFHVWLARWSRDHPDESIEEMALDIEASTAGRAAEAFVEHAFDDLERPASVEVMVRAFGGPATLRFQVTTRLVPASTAVPIA